MESIFNRIFDMQKRALPGKEPFGGRSIPWSPLNWSFLITMYVSQKQKLRHRKHQPYLFNIYHSAFVLYSMNQNLEHNIDHWESLRYAVSAIQHTNIYSIYICSVTPYGEKMWGKSFKGMKITLLINYIYSAIWTGDIHWAFFVGSCSFTQTFFHSKQQYWTLLLDALLHTSTVL